MNPKLSMSGMLGYCHFWALDLTGKSKSGNWFLRGVGGRKAADWFGWKPSLPIISHIWGHFVFIKVPFHDVTSQIVKLLVAWCFPESEQDDREPAQEIRGVLPDPQETATKDGEMKIGTVGNEWESINDLCRFCIPHSWILLVWFFWLDPWHFSECDLSLSWKVHSVCPHLNVKASTVSSHVL